MDYQQSFPKPAPGYLDDWAADDRGWLRKYYPAGQDEPHYDLTSSAEQALEWLQGLGQRAFIGTESRLMTVFDLLKQIDDGTQLNPRARITELQKRKADIDAEYRADQGGPPGHDGVDPGARALPANGNDGARTPLRLSCARPELPHARPQHTQANTALATLVE